MKFPFFDPPEEPSSSVWSSIAEQLLRTAGREPTEENPFYKQEGDDRYYCQFDEVSWNFAPECNECRWTGSWRGRLLYTKIVRNVLAGDVINMRGIEARIGLDMKLGART